MASGINARNSRPNLVASKVAPFHLFTHIWKERQISIEKDLSNNSISKSRQDKATQSKACTKSNNRRQKSTATLRHLFLENSSDLLPQRSPIHQTHHPLPLLLGGVLILPPPRLRKPPLLPFIKMLDFDLMPRHT
jgi:hypothetical protein